MTRSKSVTKLIIKVLILMMLFVLLFLISSFLYSTRYWPDVYNYLNANITIKRIPTISELELTVIGIDYTTETYATTDFDYTDITTIIDDTDIDEFMKEEFNVKRHVKRNAVIEPMKEYLELPQMPVFVKYTFLEDPEKQQNKSTTKEYDFNGLVTAKVLVYEPYELIEQATVKNTHITDTTPDGENSDIIDYQDSISSRLKSANRLNETTTTEIIIRMFMPDPLTTKKGTYFIGDRSKSIPDKLAAAAKQLVGIKTYENEFGDDTDDGDVNFLKDLVDVTHLNTKSWEFVEMVTTKKPETVVIMPDPICHSDAFCMQFTKAVFPWVVTIFVTSNATGSQFSYVCDGALITDRVIVTGARCMNHANKTWEPHNVLVFLGKGNLQTFMENEKVQKIKYIVPHPNFRTDGEGKAVDDLALLVMEDSVEFKDNIQAACIHAETSMHEAATTGWGTNGALVPIFFKRNKNENCYDKSEDIVCATYGDDVAQCPSYGGTFASKQANRWCLQGVFYGDPIDRGLCFTKNVHYTLLKNYLTWIDDTVGMYKNDVM